MVAPREARQSLAQGQGVVDDNFDTVVLQVFDKFEAEP